MTEEEVAAIDAAGAKGPSMALCSTAKGHLFKLARRELVFTGCLAILALFFLSGYFYWGDYMGSESFVAEDVV